jgi:large subunit ribosomal protein L1
MSKITKKRKLIVAKIKPGQSYSVDAAVTLLKTFASSKFNESIDVSINLGVDPRKSDQVVRSSTNLPKGTGKIVRVAVFAQGDKAELAKKAGAEFVGMDDLAEKIKAGETNFDVVIATPDAMGVVGRLGQILGPRGLMPNPKVGTVTPHVEQAIHNAKSGQVRYRTDKNGIIHCSVGKIAFEATDLQENIQALLNDLKKVKPVTSKGVYIKKITLSTTMGPGLVVDLSSVSV